jgi:hypothetical protein
MSAPTLSRIGHVAVVGRHIAEALVARGLADPTQFPDRVDLTRRIEASPRPKRATRMLADVSSGCDGAIEVVRGKHFRVWYGGQFFEVLRRYV